MNKLKTWWKKGSYWQKGFYIGFIVTIISFFGHQIFPPLYILATPTIFLALLSFENGGFLGTIALFISPIIYPILGALIGFIIGKVKVKKK